MTTEVDHALPVILLFAERLPAGSTNGAGAESREISIGRETTDDD